MTLCDVVGRLFQHSYIIYGFRGSAKKGLCIMDFFCWGLLVAVTFQRCSFSWINNYISLVLRLRSLPQSPTMATKMTAPPLDQGAVYVAEPANNAAEPYR